MGGFYSPLFSYLYIRFCDTFFKSMNYEAIHIQREVEKPFHIVIESSGKESKAIRKNRIYNLTLTRFINKLLTFYPRRNGLIVDFLPICYVSLYAGLLGFKTFYINANHHYKTYLDYSIIMNDIDTIDYIQNWRTLNSLVKDKDITLQICDDLDKAIICKRVIKNNKLRNLILLRNKKYTPQKLYDTIFYLHQHGFTFFKLRSNDTTDNYLDWRDGEWGDFDPILCIHNSSKYRNNFIVYFD
tara:strand:+ start:356 stop:1081 length:726 start_codon:yes stop_codon:yes gene_type:complete